MAGAGAPESAIAREIGISPEQMDRGVPEANATDHQDLACLPLGQVVASVRGSDLIGSRGREFESHHSDHSFAICLPASPFVHALHGAVKPLTKGHILRKKRCES